MARGVYADAKSFVSLDSWPSFTLRTRAFLIASPADAVAADWSAVAVHGLPAVPPPPAVPSVIRMGSKSSGSNLTCHGRTRFAAVPERWISEVDGVAVVEPAFAAVDIGRRCHPLTALVLADAVAARDSSSLRLREAWLDMRRWPSINRARWAIDHCDGNAQSALETAGRLAFIGCAAAAAIQRVGRRSFASISARSLLGRGAARGRRRRAGQVLAQQQSSRGSSAGEGTRMVVAVQGHSGNPGIRGGRQLERRSPWLIAAGLCSGSQPYLPIMVFVGGRLPTATPCSGCSRSRNALPGEQLINYSM